VAEIQDVQIEKIKAGNYELRMEAEDDSLYSLAASIRRIGILVPLVCRRKDDDFILVAGHRRFAAAQSLGLRTVPVVVGEYDDAQSSEVSLAENLFRQDLSPVEVAAGIKDIIDRQTMTVPEVAASLHRAPDWVRRMIDMLKWPEDVLEAVHRGRLSISAAHNVALVHDDTYREFLLRNATESGATARTTAAWLQAWRALLPAEQAISAEPVPAGQRASPAVPQAPCICCGEVFRTDELSHVPACCTCIKLIREVGTSR